MRQLIGQPLAYARANHSRFVAELKDFIRFPTVSAQPRRADDMKRCAAWLARHLGEIGLDRVSVITTDGHPIVYARWLRAPARPTLLIYGHYDVQPPDPLDEWRSPPFEPTVRGDDIFGRGASDDKGQMLAHIKAMECYLKTLGALPVNVKCIFEGEEEIGSANLIRFLSQNQRELRADLAVMSDMRVLAPDHPALTYSMRGALSLEIEVRGQKVDLHSGNFGGAVHNPLQAMSEILASLHDRSGRVTIPRFYDRVRNVSDEERRYLARTGPTDEEILLYAGAARGWGEPGFTLYERTTTRPALTINGITGGYEGPGVKAVIPVRALAKINFRLVADQEPDEIDLLFRRHIERVTPPTVSAAVRTHFKARPARIDHRHRAMRAAVSSAVRPISFNPNPCASARLMDRSKDESHQFSQTVSIGGRSSSGISPTVIGPGPTWR